MRVRKLECRGRNNSRFFRNIMPRTDFLRSSSYRFFSKVASWTSALAVSACLVFSGCGEQENNGTSNKPTTGIYFKKPDKFVKYKKDSEMLVAEGQILLTYARNATNAQKEKVQDWLKQRGAKQVGYISGTETYQYELKKGDNLNDAINSLDKMDGVWIVGPNAQLYGTLDPKPNLSTDVSSGHWWIKTIKARKAWDITTGSGSIPIAIVDTPVDTIRGEPNKRTGHFDGKNITYGQRCNRIFTDNTTGKLETEVVFYKPGDKAPADCISSSKITGEHGNDVAMYAAASGTDNKAGAGVAWKNPIISIPVSNPTSTIEVNSGISLAILMNTKVVNVSYGLDDRNSKAEDFESVRKDLLPVIEQAYKNKILVILSAANTGFKHDDNWLPMDMHLANVDYYTSNVIIVGATDDANNPGCGTPLSILTETRKKEPCKCPYDIFGAFSGNDMTVEGKVIEISAPGYALARIDFEHEGSFLKNKLIKGTSYSAPMVSGAAALMWSIRPDLKPSQVKQILLKTAQKGLSKCRDIGHGILDVEAALKMAKGTKSYTKTWTTTKGKLFPSQSVSDFESAVETKTNNYLFMTKGNPPAFEVDSNGKLIWTSKYKTTEWLESIGTTNDGFFIGTRRGILKFGVNYQFLWNNQNVKGSKLSVCYDTLHTSTGYLCSGHSKTNDGAGTMKSDSKGNEEWSKIYTTPKNKSDGDAYAISSTTDGGSILAGATRVSSGGSDAMLIKIDKNGNMQWSTSFGGDGNDEFMAVIQTSKGYVAVGMSSSTHPLIVKTDNSGKKVWMINKVKDYAATFTTVANDSDNNCLVGGSYTNDCSSYGCRGIVLRISSAGKVVNEIIFPKATSASEGGIVRKILRATDAGFVIVQQRTIRKTDKNGEVK